MEFIEPRSLSRLLFSPTPSLTGSVSWKRDDVNVYVDAFSRYHRINRSSDWLQHSETDGLSGSSLAVRSRLRRDLRSVAVLDASGRFTCP
jgi:hypothetical protein